MSTIITLASRARRRVTVGAVPRWLSALLSVALVATVIQAAGAAPALAAAGRKGSASGPVSNAFAIGGGVGGSVDQRTGAFQTSVPLVSIAGPAGTGLSLTLGYDQSLAALGAAGNRFGLGRPDAWPPGRPRITADPGTWPAWPGPP